MSQPRHLPPPPQTQARSSSTFVPPPLDGSLTIAQLYDWHFQNTPNHRLFVYTRADGSVRTIYWPEAVQAIYVGAKILRDRFKWIPGMVNTPVVSILASSDAIPYFTLIMSCLRANYVVFPISPRNSPSAVAHLVAKAGVNHILLGHEPAMMELMTAVLNILKEYPLTNPPEVSYAPLFEDLFLPDSTMISPDTLPYEYKGPDATACIMHSSGSTAFPKPIYWSNHRTIQAALIPWFGGRDLSNQVLSLHSMPMYHGDLYGHFCKHIGRWASCGLVFSAFEPKAVPSIPTPRSVFQASKTTGSDIIFCVPSFIEEWSREQEYVKWLATRGGVLYGGGPLNKEAGDYMTSQGVSIFILYGSAEGGVMSPILPAEVGYDWEYFTFPELVTPKMVPHENNTFELVMVSNDFCTPAVLNTQVEGIDSYATSDLITPHATKPGYWKIFGRTDDQIMHNTGEKTNPGPLENLLNQDPHVLSSVMFGRGRFQAGVIVDPKPAFKFDPADSIKLAEFRNKIWPTVVKMNDFAPQHSRLFKEMILVAKPEKPFKYTAKMTACRQALIADYEDEITTLYETVEETATLNIPPLVNWDATSILDFVRNAILSVLGTDLADDDDIFQHGCDSLQATWIRNALLRALRESAQLETRQDTRNFVYDHPTIHRLAHYIFAFASERQDEDESVDAKSSAMHSLVAKYAHDFPRHVGEQKVATTTSRVVLVTGTTGELGCYLLQRLLADVRIVKVYALNRLTRHQTLRERQALALVHRGLNAELVDTPKLCLLEGDLTRPDFGLTAAVYDEASYVHGIYICTSSDVKLHRCNKISHTSSTLATWPVNFNFGLRSFEPNILGLRKLIEFSLGSPFVEPPKLIFTSSIGVFQHVTGEVSLAEATIDSRIAAGTGYQQSKWIAEEILRRTGELTSVKSLVVRVGQLCGGSNGAWNAQEWVPALVQSAKVVGAIPDDDRDVAWLPVHIAAEAMVDFLESPAAGIVHLINTQPVAWRALAAVVATELNVPLVPYTEWLNRLEHAANTEDNTVPLRASRLLPFFRSLDDQKSAGEDAFGFPKLLMTQALASSQSLRAGRCRLEAKRCEGVD
ncbi:Acetyl-CoA synthetase-like protein [Mycena venus]|uniref:Acetyl-CoA synthetase-like protein n=1 Tax=Mycena venus TaxID=2733690 RepID=A0A8H6WSW8_9AGAR|nr:Acetyl-CoA synthetase-like protein [Mycena venus]